jgi:hypothetical protein
VISQLYALFAFLQKKGLQYFGINERMKSATMVDVVAKKISL